MLSRALVVATADAHDHIDTLQIPFLALVRFIYGERNVSDGGSWVPRLCSCFGALPSMTVSHTFCVPSAQQQRLVS